MAIHRNAPAAAETGRPRRPAPGIAKGNLGTGGDVLGVGRPSRPRSRESTPPTTGSTVPARCVVGA